MKHLVFTVTNDLTYDQRMQRICTSLANAGYYVSLIGRSSPGSLPFQKQPFQQHRLYCFFSKGKLMYLEYNLRLLFFLLFYKCDVICAIDLDTILPVLFSSKLKRVQRVYDAHELFTEQKEIVTRPGIQKMWLAVEKSAVPKFRFGYTVNQFIAGELERRYQVSYTVIRNLPRYKTSAVERKPGKPFIIYQGAINEGRSFETLIPAMKEVDAMLKLYGNGNFFDKAKELVNNYGLQHKVLLPGSLAPAQLAELTPTAYAAVMLFENTGLNQYYSLANRFFDYIMAGVPQVCVDYPEYRTLNDQYHVALLIPNTDSETISKALNNLLHNAVLYKELQTNCFNARKELNWEHEQKKLLIFYTDMLRQAGLQ